MKIDWTERQWAMHWWNCLDNDVKMEMFTQYKEHTFTPAIVPSDLTGREIEKIYNYLLI